MEAVRSPGKNVNGVWPVPDQELARLDQRVTVCWPRWRAVDGINFTDDIGRGVTLMISKTLPSIFCAIQGYVQRPVNDTPWCLLPSWWRSPVVGELDRMSFPEILALVAGRGGTSSEVPEVTNRGNAQRESRLQPERRTTTHSLPGTIAMKAEETAAQPAAQPATYRTQPELILYADI